MAARRAQGGVLYRHERRPKIAFTHLKEKIAFTHLKEEQKAAAVIAPYGFSPFLLAAGQLLTQA